MSLPIIQIEGLGKRYRIGAYQRPSHFTLRDTVATVPSKALARLRGSHTRTEEFWALRDVSFDIDEGDIVGVVGANGAGKSTLLKILSQIVEPTTGRAVLRGRVSSLLEVGTGFHFELTGRENIFLNGAILGMTRKEILARFDEIVDFSEIEQFIDTPVKFYSSGMYVRLAFAVAAHLEPDILIVDEVLSVGDQRFQNKSLGKMNSVARSGRTVIFVSHNMSAMVDLCTYGALLEKGRLTMFGSIEEVATAYVTPDVVRHTGRFQRDDFDPARHVLAAVELRGPDNALRNTFGYGEPMAITVETSKARRERFGLEVRIKNHLRQPVAYASSWIARGDQFSGGEVIDVALPALTLTEGLYYLDFTCRVPLVRHVDNWFDEVTFEVVNASPGGSPFRIRALDQWGSVVLEDAVFTTC